MKTIFIPVSARQQARNVLRTDILKTLQADHVTRVVILAPSAKIPQYSSECRGPNTFFEGADIPKKPISRLDAFLGRLSLFYINSRTARYARKQWLLDERRQPIRYFVSLSLLFILGNSRVLQNILRRLDLYLVRDERLGHFFDTYQPDLVFTPKITSSLDRLFLRQAKRRGVKTVGMISAWDNITLAKYPFRLLPERLVAQNEIIKKEAIKYLGLPADTIFVSGMPHFDFYFSSERLSREKFCAALGVSPDKRIVLFASIGNSLNPTEGQVVSLLEKAIESGRLPKDIVIVFRQHPTEKTKIEDVASSPCVVIDDSKTVFEEKGFSEILKKDMEHLADSLYHAAVTINTASTMSIDAAVFDKPVVNIAFDGWEKKPFHESVRRFYAPSHDHYQPIVKSGGVRIAYSIDELIDFINLYFKNPQLDAEGRKRIVEEQCYKLDGRSGERIANFILSNIDHPPLPH